MSENAEKLSHESFPHPLDIHVGQKLRQRRLMLGLTQEKLGALLGLTFQQVQKYERGQNRVSASRLYEVAKALRVPVAYFFEDAPDQGGPPGLSDQKQEALEDNSGDYNARETAELMRAYYRIDDPKKRKRVLDLIRAMSGEE
ncbi:MAG TPA: helix-turn-helix transcriptional regulator [Alphaproteobacteria bacterium]|nr:helix-turn-helix transcriptional regulator [Alphaproteobacteria bacterium]